MEHWITAVVIRAYGRLLVEGLPQAKDSVVVIGRLLEWFLSQSIGRCRLYLREPKGLWQQVNALYVLAEMSDLLAEPYNLQLNPQDRHSTITNLVMQHVMLNRIYQKPLNEKQSVTLMKVLPDLATLGNFVAEDPTDRCMFVVDVAADRPPDYTARAKNAKESMTVPRYVNVSRVMDTLSHDVADKHGVIRRLGPDIVDRIRALWSEAPTRRTDRTESSGTLEFSVGVYQAFAKVFDGVSPGAFMERYHKDWLKNPMHPMEVSRKGTEAIEHTGDLRDESVTGLAVVCDSGVERLENGELIIYQSADSKKFVLSVVRRIQFEGKSKYSFGLQNILHDPKPCVVQMINREGKASAGMPGFSAKLLGIDERPSVILFPRMGGSSAQAALRVFSENSVDMYKQKKTVLRTGFVVAVSYEPLTDDEMIEYEPNE